MYKLNWTSLTNIPIYGYAETSKNMMFSLDEQGVKIHYRYVYGSGTLWGIEEPVEGLHPRIAQFRLQPQDPGQPEVIYATGDVFLKNSGRYKIGFTMLEVDGISSEWVKQCNRMDEVWVPSSFNVETFRNSGVKVPIHIIPLGINPLLFNTDLSSQRYSDKFTFLSVFQWSGRKNPEQLIKSFWKAFSSKEDVILVLKTNGYLRDQDFNHQINHLGIKNWQSKIILDDRRLPEKSMGQIYRSADCFVLPTSGEGWGMPILEAMACGIPVIATGWGGQQDFFNEETGYPIRIKGLVPCSVRDDFYNGFRWAEPDFDYFVEQMRYVYENRDLAKERSEKVASKVVSQWTWRHTSEKIISRLSDIHD